MKCFCLALFPMNCVFVVTLKSHTANIASSQWNCTNLIAHLLTMCYTHDSNTNAIVLHVNLVAVLMWCDATYLRALSYCLSSANYNTIDAAVNHTPLQNSCHYLNNRISDLRKQGCLSPYRFGMSVSVSFLSAQSKAHTTVLVELRKMRWLSLVAVV